MLGKEFLYAARTLRKSPIFLVTATVTIAAGIGAAVAMFGVVNGILLRSLPYKDPDRLVIASGDLRARKDLESPLSNENYLDLKNGTKAMFEDMAAVSTGRINVPREDGTPEQIRFAQVTVNFLPLMGAKIAVGRQFDESDSQPQPPPDPAAGPNAPAAQRLPFIAILSHDYWQKRFGGNPDIIGKRIFNGAGLNPQVVGVLAPGFELLFRPSSNVEVNPDIWIASRAPYSNANRNAYFWHPVGRLRPGVSVDQARDAGEVVAASIRRDFQVYSGADFHFHMEPMKAHLVAEVRPTILALMGAVIFLLLIACANVANLLLVRMSLRERELAVRAALGGSRLRLIEQTLAEAVLMAAGGTILGLGLAQLAIRELIAIAPASLPRLDAIRLDPAVLGFGFLVGLGAAAAFGVIPALRASRPNVMGVLRGSSRTAALGAAGPRNAAVMIEVALSFVLLIGCGLMVRSFLELQRVHPGFDASHLLTFQVLGGRGGNQPQQRAAYVREIEERLRTLPGVESVTASDLLPLAGGFSTIRWGKEEALSDSSKYQAVEPRLVLPGYFETMGTPLLAGRTFTDADNAPDRNRVMIDQELATKAFPNESAVGKRILIRLRTPEPEWVEIIGVVAHQMTTSLTEPGREQVYFTDGFANHGRVARWMLRTAGDPATYAARAREALKALDPHLALFEVQTMDTVVEHAQASTKFSLLLIGAFASIAALLAGVGLYGVLSTVVRQRTAEIGVRMALGAAPARIFNLVIGQGLRLSGAGIVLGIAAALALTRAMKSMLVNVRPSDPATFAAMILFFFAIAALASWIPAIRAANLDPTVALREE